MDNKTKAWERFEAGREYKRRIGLYSTVRQNERFYRGDQWHGVDPCGLPTPVFNVIKRIVDYMVSSVAKQPVSIVYSDDSMPVTEMCEQKNQLKKGIELLNGNAAYRCDKSKLDVMIRQALTDAAISGDGVFYCYWEPDLKTGQPHTGDIKTVLCNNTDLFVSNVNSRDIQEQDYVMLAGRDSVEHLFNEAIKNGVKREEAEKITAEDAEDDCADAYRTEATDSDHATYLLTFTKDKDGYVSWEKSTRSVVIAKRKTKMKRYPIAYFAWDRIKGSFIGNSPVTALTENQKYINKAYAMVMKHMTDTAFSKVVYDKTLIPEWTNEVGEAIGVRGGGDVRNSVSVVGTGQLQSGFLEIIAMTLTHTKEMMGATDTALGEVKPENTSAILALQEASAVPLETLRQNLYACIEDLALIWADMLLSYYPADRLVIYRDADGEEKADRLPDPSVMKKALLSARVDVGAGTRYSQIVSLNTLDKLLAGGYITMKQYIQRLPDGIISDKEELLYNDAESKS
ncbi:MAG: hypothetical protein J5879_01505 [Clostridia bacterium]|nr:hypothetical protein [Clostridia bacterium]